MKSAKMGGEIGRQESLRIYDENQYCATIVQLDPHTSYQDVFFYP